MPTITRKIELKLCTEGLSEEERKAQWDFLHHINNNLYRSANNVSSKLYLDEYASSLVSMRHKEYKSLLRDLAKARKNGDDETISNLEAKIVAIEQLMTDQEKAICKYADEMTTETLSYQFATEQELHIYGQILNCERQNVYKNFEKDSKDVREGKRSIRTYKKGMPIPFPWTKSIRIESVKKPEDREIKGRRDKEDYDFYLYWYKPKSECDKALKFRLHFGKDRSNNYQIVKRCLKLDEKCNDNYSMGTSSIQLKKTPSGPPELYLLLVVNIPKEKYELNNKIVVGVDLGINVPAYVATNITEDRKAIGSREHFLNTRLEFDRRRRSLQRLEGTASGKGRKKKLEPLERLRDRERNWVKTQNHRFSRDAVDFAIKVKAATIQMEDLSGYGCDDEGNVKEDKKFLLGKWSYYELQNMIKTKAQKAGIKVNIIEPAYTSKTCSWCGEIGIRNGTSFTCQNPNCKQYGVKDIHADYNAARNIALSTKIVK